MQRWIRWPRLYGIFHLFCGLMMVQELRFIPFSRFIDELQGSSGGLFRFEEYFISFGKIFGALEPTRNLAQYKSRISGPCSTRFTSNAFASSRKEYLPLFINIKRPCMLQRIMQSCTIPIMYIIIIPLCGTIPPSQSTPSHPHPPTPPTSSLQPAQPWTSPWNCSRQHHLHP